jgi:hypothetical protein
MTKKLPMLLTLAALAGLAAPAFAAESHAAKHDPQVATTTAKPKAPPAKETKSAPKSTKAKAPAKSTATPSVSQPAQPAQK